MFMFNKFWITYGETITSLAKGAAIAAIGASITYGLGEIGDMEFGDKTVFVAAGVSVLVNAVRKFGVPLATVIFKGSSY